MSRRTLITVVICAVFGALTFLYISIRCPSPSENKHDLWMAALKGFMGTVRYIGDDDQYSYFKTGSDFSPRYKRLIHETNLPTHFLLGEGKPYRVDHKMVPQYVAPASELDGTIDLGNEPAFQGQ